MSIDPLEQFKMKIADYSLEQLEEVLISLNKDKFPEKYQVVRETLSNKKGGGAYNPSESMHTTVVDIRHTSKIQIPSLSSETPNIIASKPQALPETTSLSNSIASPSSSLPLPAPQVKALDSKEEPGRSGLQLFFLISVVLTSLLAIYCALLSTMDLPGKSLMLKMAQKLPELTS